MIETKTEPTSRLQQGDVIRDVELIERITETSGVIEVAKIVFPLVVVLTQDCDLEQESRFLADNRSHDKTLLSVLVAPLYNAEHVYRGEHLSELEMKMEPINHKKSPGQFLRNNERRRYHYLEFPESVPVVPSVIDFKHYFSVAGDYLRQVRSERLICTIGALFREDVSQRFAFFLARIGLPEPAAATTERAA